MAVSTNVTVQRGASPLFVVFIVFLVLKLTDNVDWSWWWVSSPMWMPVALFGVIVAPIPLFKFFAWIFDAVSQFAIGHSDGRNGQPVPISKAAVDHLQTQRTARGMGVR